LEGRNTGVQLIDVSRVPVGRDKINALFVTHPKKVFFTLWKTFITEFQKGYLQVFKKCRERVIQDC
jgi:hypothetical protein